MDLEAVDTGRAVSQLSEVGMMQRSFVTMVANLVEYRNYMPQSVLVNDSEQDVSDTESATRDTKSKSDASRSKVSHTEPSSTEVVQTQKALLRVEGMKKKKVSLAHMNVVSWHAFCEGRKDAEVLAAHGSVIERILVAVQHNKGVCDTFCRRQDACHLQRLRSELHTPCCLCEGCTRSCNSNWGCAQDFLRVHNRRCHVSGTWAATDEGRCRFLHNAWSWVVVLERWNKSTTCLVSLTVLCHVRWRDRWYCVVQVQCCSQS